MPPITAHLREWGGRLKSPVNPAKGLHRLHQNDQVAAQGNPILPVRNEVRFVNRKNAPIRGIFLFRSSVDFSGPVSG